MFIYGTSGEIPTEEELKKWKALWNTNSVLKTEDDKDNLSFSFIPVIWDINENIELDKQFIKSSTMKKQQTEGERRVRKSFNPNALKRVENFKSITASAIDEIVELERRVKNATKDHSELGDFLRECATAKTNLQDASMWGVCALTHVVAFDTLDNAVSEVQNELPPHQQRVITERDELATKADALGKFISNNPIYSTLPKEEQDDLLTQHRLMIQYHIVLNNRINRF